MACVSIITLRLCNREDYNLNTPLAFMSCMIRKTHSHWGGCFGISEDREAEHTETAFIHFVEGPLRKAVLFLYLIR